METRNNGPQIIDLAKVFRTIWANRSLFYKVWVCTFVLSCIWILPQPRYYISEVRLAPEMSGEDVGGENGQGESAWFHRWVPCSWWKVGSAASYHASSP